ncbi:MAG: cyclic nucleotide-binding domain-containing protein, partial [Candidatus Sulfotelmatobacter sp.]
MTHELLNGLSSAEVEQVLELGTRLIVATGTSLFRLGEPADRLFLIERGRIRLTLPMPVRGREEDIFVEERSPGQAVGWS